MERVQWVRVSGPSMVPTLHHGDLVLVRRGATIRPGDVVLARFHSMPERLVLKRADHPVDSGWWLASDNEFAGGDSEVHGPAEGLGRVLLRVSPPGRGVRRMWRSPTRVRRGGRSWENEISG